MFILGITRVLEVMETGSLLQAMHTIQQKTNKTTTQSTGE